MADRAKEHHWLSVRAVATLTSALLGAVALVAIAALAWTSVELEVASRTLVRAAQSRATAGQVLLRLFTYQRLGNIGVITGERQVAAAQRADTRKLANLLARARAYHADDPAEARLLGELSGLIAAYIQQRGDLEALHLPLQTIVAGTLPSFRAAQSSARELWRVDTDRLDQIYDQTQRIGRIFGTVAAVAALLVIAALVAVAWSVRKHLLRPILALRSAIERYPHDSRRPVGEGGPREIGEIARAFNQMNRTLGEQRANQVAFLAGVAHDLRDPLSAVKTGIELLQLQCRERDGAGSEHRTLQMIDRQIERWSRMVGDLLDMSRIEAGELELSRAKLDLREIARTAVTVCSAECPEREVELETPDTPVLVDVDAERIEQVINNLLQNAIKYSPEDSRVTVRILRDDNEAVITVTDRGIGVDEEDLEAIFQPFRRSSRANVRTTVSGSGLGLSIVKRIVTAHDGRVDVESKKNVGSTFRVHLPLDKRPERPPHFAPRRKPLPATP